MRAARGCAQCRSQRRGEACACRCMCKRVREFRRVGAVCGVARAVAGVRSLREDSEMMRGDRQKESACARVRRGGGARGEAKPSIPPSPRPSPLLDAMPLFEARSGGRHSSRLLHYPARSNAARAEAAQVALFTDVRCAFARMLPGNRRQQ